MRLDGHRSAIFNIAFNPVKRILASGDDYGEIRLWDLDSGTTLEIFQPPVDRKKDGSLVAFSPDGSILAAWPFETNYQLALWNFHLRKVDGTFECVNVNSIVWSPDGLILACAERIVTLRDGKTGKKVKELEIIGHKGSIVSLAWSSNARLLATGGDEDNSSIQIWDVEKSEQVAIYKSVHYAQNIKSISFYSDDALIYIDVSGQPYIWYWKTNKEPQIINQGVLVPDIDNYPTQLNSSGQYIARISSVDYRILHIIDLATGIKSTFYASDGHEEVISYMVFSTDSRTLASGDFAGTVYTWELSPRLGGNQPQNRSIEK